MPLKRFFEAEMILFMHQTYEPCVFLQKTALNLVKCGLHSRTYYLHPHIGGSHPVLYFTIEKYSNSNVLPRPAPLQMYPGGYQNPYIQNLYNQNPYIQIGQM